MNVSLLEVGPRDGLQNEKQPVSTATKQELIRRLADCGLKAIEATAFVSPKWVPQMADAAAVMAGLEWHRGVSYPVLVPNLQGLEAALAAGAREVAVFAAASETFSRKNTNCSIAESIARFQPVMAAARAAGVPVRGYVSCALGCPYEGAVAADAAARVVAELFEVGCAEVGVADTIGVATPHQVRALIAACAPFAQPGQLAGHFHDTYGMAVANIQAALDAGIRRFDSAVAGLGGCPYAPGAAGNVATEDVVYLLHGQGIETGIDLDRLYATGEWICQQLGRSSASRVAQARQRCTAR
jgi:isopropylmalate/homocitrate/citramalate synthase